MERNKFMQPITPRRKKTASRHSRLLFAAITVIGSSYFAIPATIWQMVVPRAQAATFTVTNTSDVGLGSLRDAILSASLTPLTADTISFNIPPTDPRHFYYQNNSVAGTVSRSMIAVTASSDDSLIGDIDPDWPHSWYSIETAGFVGGPLYSNPVTFDGFSQPGSVPTQPNPSGSLNSVLKIEVTNSATDFSCSRIFHIAFRPGNCQGIDNEWLRPKLRKQADRF
jgi:hypothetical protein